MAAIYVVLHHLTVTRGWSGPATFLLRFGQEAVLLFFVLSGFVIFANEHERALRPRGYFLRRLRRIYPPLLVAIAVSAIVAIDNGQFREGFIASELAGTLASLQDLPDFKPGVIVGPFMGNGPLWSLSYEVAFYLIFPVALIAWTRRPQVTNHVIGAACCLCYIGYALMPNHFMLVGAYFLVWWCGAMAARAYLHGERSILSLGVPFAWLALLCLIAATVVAIVGFRGNGYYPFLPFRHFVAGALILALFFGPVGARIARFVLPAAALFEAGASISYGLYVLHFPLLVSWWRANQPGGIALGVIVLLVLAYITERIVPRWLPRAPAD